MSKKKNRSLRKEEEVTVFERRQKVIRLIAWVAILAVTVTTGVTFAVASIGKYV